MGEAIVSVCVLMFVLATPGMVGCLLVLTVYVIVCVASLALCWSAWVCLDHLGEDPVIFML